VTARILLNPGQNTIRVTSIGKNGPNIDWIRYTSVF
jgi:hypothetical protein